MAKNPWEMDFQAEQNPVDSNAMPWDINFDQEAPAQQSVGQLQKTFPKAVEAAESPDQADTRNPQAMAMEALKKYGSIGLGGLQDMFSMEQRSLGELFGQSKVEDPQGGYFKEAREKNNKFYDEHIADVESNPYLSDAKKKIYKTGLSLAKETAQAASQFMESPVSSFTQPLYNAGKSGLNLASKAVPAIKDAILKTADLGDANAAVEALAKGGQEADLIRSGAKESPDAMAVDVMGNINRINKSGEEFATQANALKQQDLEQGANLASPRKGGVVSPYEAGTKLELARVKAKTDLGKIFQDEQERLLTSSGVDKNMLRQTPVGKKSFIKGTTENAAQKELQGLLKEWNYNPETQILEVGNRPISNANGAIDEIFDVYKSLGGAKNTKDILTQRRLIQNRIDYRPIGMSKESDWVLKQVSNKLNDTIEKQFFIGNNPIIKDKKTAQIFSKAWRANNENYATVTNVMGDNFGDISKLNPEEYIGKINSIGIDNLKNMFQTSKKYTELKPVVDELRAGFVDNLLARSQKGGVMDYASLKRNWTNLDPALKKTMLTASQEAQINHTIDRYTKTAVAEPQSISRFFTEKNAEKTLMNIGTQDKIQALKELKFYDDINGLKGKDRLSEKAIAMYRARRLGMKPNGTLPISSDIRTGKAQMAASAGMATGASAGAAIAGPVGAAIGAPIGAMTGIFSQSPAGAVIAFKALNKIGGKNITGAGKIAKNAAANISARGGINQLNYVGNED